ncbi:MAG: VWA domain-containing protein [Halioglobus sp.]|nr:VWA domain-containing protein [Halioglobus sp.]
MSLEHYWILLLLPLPLLVYRFLPARRESEQSLRVPFFERLVRATGSNPGEVSVIRRRRLAQKILLSLLWIALVLVVAEPVRYGALVKEREYGRDLMVAVDLSQSMEKKDFPGLDGEKISRWSALQNLMNQFARGREGDRLGLIAFGSGAYLQVPFTPDAGMWMNLLGQLQTGMAGSATAIGDAIGLAMRTFETSHSKQKMLILVTDGSDNASRLPAVEAAKVAVTQDVTIYTIAIGDPAKQSGDDKVDVGTLTRIAEITGGKTYQAIDAKALQTVLADINKIQPSAYDTTSSRPKTLLYPWILGPILILYLLLWVWLSAQELTRNWRVRRG